MMLEADCLIIFLIVLGSADALTLSSECDKQVDDVLAECTKKHLDESLEVPRTVRDLNSKCTSFKEAGICLKNYAYKCMDDESRVKTGLILSGITLVGGAFCGSQQEKEDFISHTRCLNSTSLREIQCRKAFMQVLRVGKYVHPDMKIGVSCCYYNEFSKCLDTLFVDAGDRCSPQSFDYFREMSLKFRSNTIDMLCGSRYSRNSEKCDQIVGGSITGKDILVKYLIGVFASKSNSNPVPAALEPKNSIIRKYPITYGF